MTTRPNINAPLVEKDGRISRVWVDYIRREMGNVEPLSEAATDADIISKVNEIITALEDSGLGKKG